MKQQRLQAGPFGGFPEASRLMPITCLVLLQGRSLSSRAEALGPRASSKVEPASRESNMVAAAGTRSQRWCSSLPGGLSAAPPPWTGTKSCDPWLGSRSPATPSQQGPRARVRTSSDQPTTIQRARTRARRAEALFGRPGWGVPRRGNVRFSAPNSPLSTGVPATRSMELSPAGNDVPPDPVNGPFGRP
jgi:hypothetical protein